MAESTLALSYPDLREKVGFYQGYGRDTTLWTTPQSDDVEDLLDSGYRQVLTPPLLQGQIRPHTWRFLRPTSQIVTVADKDDYDLPDDFAQMDGNLIYVSNTTRGRVTITSESAIRLNRSSDATSSGVPYLAATRPKRSDAASGQRFEIMFWPTPDAAYTLQYRYAVQVNRLTTNNPWPLGGAQMAELLLESCLAIAEHRMDDSVTGHHQARFKELLAAAIDREARATAAETVGYNGDPGARVAWSPAGQHGWSPVTYEGVLYDG